MKKAIKIVVLVLVAIGLLVGGTYFAIGRKLSANTKLKVPTAELFTQEGADRLHFLSVGASDCILVESGGLFGLIDAGEDTAYPADKPNLELPGYEEDVVRYLKKVAGDENGKVTLDFVLGTHAHSDHIGGFDTVLNDPDITVRTGYLKEYHADNIRQKERDHWDNQEVYDQMTEAMLAGGVEIIQELEDVSFTLGSFTLQILNGETDFDDPGIGENENSLVVLLQKGEKKAVLSGDLNYLDGDEKRLAKQIGKVDLLKAGHHGYVGSSSMHWVKTLDPELVVVTNYQKKMYPDVLFKFAFVSNSALYCTGDQGGIIASFPGDGDIVLTNQTM